MTRRNGIARPSMQLAFGAALLAAATARADGELSQYYDVAVEQMAQQVVYHDKDNVPGMQTYINDQGWSIGSVIDGEQGFAMRVFTATRSDRPTVVAFRGTVKRNIGDIVSDADPNGIGKDQFASNKALIEKTLKSASSSGRVVVAGHSLGGSLAQTAAAHFPSLIARVVTFHTPGVTKELADKVKDWNAANPSQAIDSAHYELEEDIVEKVGDALTPGTIYRYKLAKAKKTSYVELHTTYILADWEYTAGQSLPIHDSDRPVLYKENLSSTRKPSDALEDVRKTVGAIFWAPSTGVYGVDAAAEQVGKDAKKLFKKK